MAMDRPVRVAVVGEGPVARRYAVAAASLGNVDLVPAPNSEALILADAAALPAPAATAIAATDRPMLIDPGLLASLGATPESRSALRALQTPALVALPWRGSPVVRLARRILGSPKFIHARVTTWGIDPLTVAAVHTLDILTLLMGQPPNRVYAEAAGGASTGAASPSALAGTLEFDANRVAAFAVSRLEGPSDGLSAVVQLTDGRRAVTLTNGLSKATLTGFTDAEIGSAGVPITNGTTGKGDTVTVDWRPSDGVADAVCDLVRAVRTGQAPPEATNLASGLRTAALVRAAFATVGSGRPRRLVAR